MKKAKDIITPDQIINIILRRRLYILVPFIITLTIGAYQAIILPKIYEAKTLILVEPQRVPEDYVRSLVTQDISIRVRTVRHQILSRSNLEKVIDKFQLFSGIKYDRMFMEDKLAIVRNNILVDLTTSRDGADVFTISFKGKKPEKVMNVANSLASYFIDENLRVRESQATGTSEFLDTELTEMEKDLEEVEEALKVYREQYMGELPEELQTNLTILSRLQERLSSTQQNIQIENNRLLSLDQQISMIQNQTTSSDNISQELEIFEPVQTELVRLRNELADHKSRYTDRHPDVIRLENRIKELEFDAKTKETTTQQIISNEVQTEENPIVAEYMRQKNDIQQGIQLMENDISDILKKISFYERRVENTPKREMDLISLRRDYQNIQHTYNSLLSRKLESEIALNMEKMQKGEQFRIVDKAKRPEKPISPDINKVLLIFLAAGIGVGGGLVFLMEYLDTSFRKPEDLESLLEIPVLCTIPKLIHQEDKRRRLANQAPTVICLGVSFVLLAGYAVMSLKGVDKTIEYVRRFVDI